MTSDIRRLFRPDFPFQARSFVLQSDKRLFTGPTRTSPQLPRPPQHANRKKLATLISCLAFGGRVYREGWTRSPGPQGQHEFPATLLFFLTHQSCPMAAALLDRARPSRPHRRDRSLARWGAAAWKPRGPDVTAAGRGDEHPVRRGLIRSRFRGMILTRLSGRHSRVT